MTDAQRPRILLVTRNLPPLVGGMERLNWHMADELSRYADVRVIGPSGSAALAPRNVRLVEVPLRPLWKFIAFAQWRAVREARRWRPDIVLAGSGLTGLPAWTAARVSRAGAAAYVHGLDLAVRNLLYRALWLPALRRSDCIIANSSVTSRLCLDMGINSGRVHIVHPGVEMPACAPCAGSEATEFRDKHDLGRRPILLSVGRLSARKGLGEFVAHCLPRIVSSRPEAILVIIGDAPKDALHAEALSPAAVLDVAAEIGLQDHVRFLGRLPESDLLSAYRAADIHVFPVREIPGDLEGFGMVAVEAAANGLPTVAFASGGVVDAVADGKSGRLIPAGDYAAFAEAVLNLLDAGAVMEESCVRFARNFEWRCFGQRLHRALWPDCNDRSQ